MPGTAHRAHGIPEITIDNLLCLEYYKILFSFISHDTSIDPQTVEVNQVNQTAHKTTLPFSRAGLMTAMYMKKSAFPCKTGVCKRWETRPFQPQQARPHPDTPRQQARLNSYNPIKISLPKCKSIIKISKTRLRTTEEIFTSLLSVIDDTTKELTRTSLSGGLLGHISISPYLSFVHTHFWFQGCFALLWLKYFGVPHSWQWLRDFHTSPQRGPFVFSQIVNLHYS